MEVTTEPLFNSSFEEEKATFARTSVGDIVISAVYVDRAEGTGFKSRVVTEVYISVAAGNKTVSFKSRKSDAPQVMTELAAGIEHSTRERLAAKYADVIAAALEG